MSLPSSSNCKKDRAVLLVDMSTWKGHHEIYFKNILLTLANSNLTIYASCQDNPALGKWIEELGLHNCYVLDARLSMIDRLALKALSIVDKILTKLPVKVAYKYSSIASLLFVKNFLKQIGQDAHVFFAHADSAMSCVPIWIAKLLLPTSWIALSIQPSYRSAIFLGRDKSRQWFAAEKLFSLPSCKAVLVLHSVYQIFFEKRFKQKKILIFPEIVDVEIYNKSEIAERVRILSSGRKIISIIGSLLPKRNLKLFLESAKKLSVDEYFILVVGNFPQEYYSISEVEDIKNILKFPNNSYINLNYYIPDETEFNKLLEISDVIYLQYYKHPYSSNILSKSIKLRKPVIINSGYLMETVVKTYDWQSIVAEDPELIAKEIINLAHDFKINEEKYALFLADYSKEKNNLAICEALKFL